MHFSYAYHTDVGTTREVNQDALVIKTWNQSGNSVFLGAVCDGLGGLARGEEASRRAAGLTQQEFAMRSGLGLRFVRELEQGKETVRMDKVNIALAMFGMEAVPGKIARKDEDQ